MKNVNFKILLIVLILFLSMFFTGNVDAKNNETLGDLKRDLATLKAKKQQQDNEKKKNKKKNHKL